MRIGIITFHWGTNYGGVLQSYALQNFLTKQGHDAYMINYYPVTPSESIWKCIKTKQPRVLLNNLITYFKERNFVPFRNKHLSLTKRYYSLEELVRAPPEMDVYVCGSDQVWNPYIIKTYGKPYYLRFGPDNIKRVSYAVSFGCINYPQKELEIITPWIEKFDKLSVRENSGLSILKNAKIDNVALMPDPTLLFTREDLDELLSSKTKNYDVQHAFFYILQDKQICISEVLKNIKKDLVVVNNQDFKYSTMGIEDWLVNIRDSKFVITNLLLFQLKESTPE
jgi:hypothetical protein